ncbi:hypothetical protein HK405_007950 [Cladochytrium tenue]|nr:hypothetical protein HK405_007950 [Cladochytrium tenue]
MRTTPSGFATVACLLASASLVTASLPAAATTATTVSVSKAYAKSHAHHLAGLHLARAKYSDASLPFLMASTADASDSSVASTSEVLDNEHDFMWSCNVTLNGQEYPIDLDTGSADTWFISSFCTGDKSCKNGHPTINVTDLLSSGSYTFMNKSWYTTYGTGGVAGPLYWGPISIGAYTANVSFGLGFIVLQMTGASGLMGLGFESLSNINEL